MGSIKYRVLLDSKSDQETFRDFLISDQDNFESLYNSILKAFDLEGNVMASFYVSNDEWDKGQEICLLDMSMDDKDNKETALLMSETTIHQMDSSKHEKFILIYDFMNMWIFLIECIGKENSNPKTPKLVLSVGENPLKSESMIDQDFMFESDEIKNEEEDYFDDFDDGYSEEDYSDYNDEFY